MSSFDFTNVQAAEGGSYTRPGTIGLFNIAKVEFGTSKEQQTAFMRLTFQCKKMLNDKKELVDESSVFPHEFYMTVKAIPRVQYLSKVMFDEELSGEVTDQALIARFLNKDVALKVIGKVSDKGKGYADLPFAGFAKKASDFLADPSSLNFSAAERALVEDALEAIASSSSSRADKEAPAPEPSKPGKVF